MRRRYDLVWWIASSFLYAKPFCTFAFGGAKHSRRVRLPRRTTTTSSTIQQRQQQRHDLCCSSVGNNVVGADREELARMVLPFLAPERFRLESPAEALRKGVWFKLICGASFEDLPAVRNLAVVYTLAGADCIDVAAEEAVIEAARDGVVAARALAEAIGAPIRAPWLMMSINDDEEDPHFRKAAFDPALCPSDCPRPCEMVCPTDAIVFPDSIPSSARRMDMVSDLLARNTGGGVLEPRCYGCGRCINVCPPGIIRAEKYMRSPEVVRRLVAKVDAVEIHTKGDLQRFRRTWEDSVAAAVDDRRLKLVAVSFPDLGPDTGLAIAAMNAVMSMALDNNNYGDGVKRRDVADVGLSCGEEGPGVREVEEEMAEERSDRRKGTGARGESDQEPVLNVWQTDGRPMSGDITAGATAACIRLAEKVVATEVLPFGEGQHFVQLAGGTNDRTAPKLRKRSWLTSPGSLSSPSPFPSDTRRRGIGGVAYGGFARKIVGQALDRLPSGAGGAGAGRGNKVEEHPQILASALHEAFLLVEGLKQQRQK